MRKQKITISYIIQKLASQSGEEKLRIAFKLSSFVNKIKSAGAAYATKQHQPRTTA